MPEKKVSSRKRKESQVFKKTAEHAQEHHHWNFPPVYPHQPGEHGLPKDFKEHPQDINVESLCGGRGNGETQPVEKYDGTLGVSTAFVNAHQAPVGQLQWNNDLASIYTDPGMFQVCAGAPAH